MRSNAGTFIRNNAEGIKIVLLIVAGLYTAVAGLYTVLVYNREATNNRIEDTLAFKERAEMGDLSRAFKRIDMLWIQNDAATSALQKYRIGIKYTMDPEQLNKYQEAFDESVTYFIETKQLHDEIFAIHGFYKSINICVIQGRCHAPTACQLFAEDLQNFRSTYAPFLIKWDKLWDTDVLRSLEGFCTRCEEHLPPGEGQCSKVLTHCDGEMHVSP